MAEAARTLVRVLDELLWVLRREGFALSTAQAIDAVRAVSAVGLADRWAVREALAAVVVQRSAERPRYDAVFDGFFASDAGDDPGARPPRPNHAHGNDPRARSLWDRLSARGFDEGELAALRVLLDSFAHGEEEGPEALGVLLGRGAELDRWLARSGLDAEIDAHSEARLGFLVQRQRARVGSAPARRALDALRGLLAGALGARGEGLAAALAEELDETEAFVRAHVRRTYERRAAEHDRARAERRLATTPFAALRDEEIEEVRRAVRRFADGLRGGARIRARHRARRGRIDTARTWRGALATGGVPLRLARRRRVRDRPRIVLLCDVSESVRAAACFLLEFTYAVQELFARARSFLFVSELEEATSLFAREPVRVAVARAWSGEVVRAGENSNYGRALRAFEARYAREVDRRTTVVILGDGRTNYLDPAADVLDRLRDRARAVVWLCPEPRGLWGQGDSVMAEYAKRATAVHVVRSAADLELAARSLVRAEARERR